MRNILLATTALMMTTGFAAAEVSLRGSAEMGMLGGDDAPGGEDTFFTDLDVRFSMSVSTDNGLTFGAAVDLDESDGSGTRGSSNAFDGTKSGGEVIFISGDFGTITMGDPDGALNWAVGGAVIGGSINDAVSSHIGWSESDNIDGAYDGQRFSYQYTAGDLAFNGTIELDDTGVGDPIYAIGGRYLFRLTGASVTLAAGYQTVDLKTGVAGSDVDAFGVSVNANFENGFRAIATYTDFDGYDGDGLGGDAGLDDHFGVAIGYEIGSLLLAANYGSYSLVGGGENNGYAVSVGYDLGGGIQFQAGYSKDDDAANVDNDRYDVGLSMSF